MTVVNIKNKIVEQTTVLFRILSLKGVLIIYCKTYNVDAENDVSTS